ncbi:MAG: aldehyde ferredoxin oxidoreductase N-terminal domain-containing protein [Anaerolineae bacterium]
MRWGSRHSGVAPPGAEVPSSSRLHVSARSPLTGPLGSSNVGGHFGAELRAAAVQTLLIQGRAPRPVTLWFDGDRVELRDTTHLWGLDTRAAESLQGDLAGDCGRGRRAKHRE